MQTSYQHTTTILEIKQSKFIAHLMPFCDFKTVLSDLKEEHPKARHFVTAFRYLNEHDQIVEGSSDDGEPKGTSGKPSLAVLAGQECINVGVIIVRYFGGTKLGTGGLVRAYGDAVNLVLSEGVFEPYVKEFVYEYEVLYTNVSRIEYLLTQSHLKTSDKVFQTTSVLFRVVGALENFEQFDNETQRITKKIE